MSELLGCQLLDDEFIPLQPRVTMETMPQTSTSAYDHLLKILLIGDTGSNKRALLRTYLDDQEIGERSTTTLGT